MIKLSKKNHQFKTKLNPFHQQLKFTKVKLHLFFSIFLSLISLDEASAATGTDDKKISSKNKKKAAAEKKGKGGVDAKTVCFLIIYFKSKEKILKLFLVKSYERISKETRRS
jgi:hypothetical protein